MQCLCRQRVAVAAHVLPVVPGLELDGSGHAQKGGEVTRALPLPAPLKQRLLESDSAALALRVLAALVKTKQNDA